MTNGRIRKILKLRLAGAQLHAIYEEVYGADFAGKVTDERARESVREACRELLERPATGVEEAEPAKTPRKKRRALTVEI